MPNSESQDEFLATARKRFTAAAEDERHLREKFVSDLKFASPDGDDQWDPLVKQQREAAGRPAMSFPRCHTFVQQVSNEARQNKPQVKFAQSDAGSDEAAEIMEGLARHIQYASDAQVAYETAIEYSAGGSFGFYRILTEYGDYDTDDQDIVVKPIRDPLTVYGVLLPAVFGRKARFWFVVEDIPKDEYKAIYGDSDMASLSWSEAEKRADGWVGSDTVRIAEYWWVTEEKVKGKRRPKCTIHTCKMNGLEILPGDDGESSKTVWPGTKCNIIPVLGKQMIIGGKARLSSVVRPQKAAQQMLNYAKTRIAETLSTAPISPFMVVEGQISGYEKEWGTINTVVRPYIPYKAVDVNGHPAPPPERQTFEPPIASLSAFVAQEVDDMKATTGIFDASLGQQGNETSGQAILKRQMQGSLNNMHFMDNLERSFKQAGEVIGELIPMIYDGARTVKILGPDESQKIVKINQEHPDENGQIKNFDLSALKGTWVVTMGKSYGSKRSESFDTISQVVQTSPNMLPMVGDILFRNSDLAGADELAERFHKMLPPQLQEDDQNPLPPQAQAAVAQAQQQTQMMQGEMQKLMMERQGKVLEHQGKMQQIAAQHQADMELEDKKLETQLAVAEIGAKTQSVAERQAFEQDMWKQLHGQAHDAALAAQGHAQTQQLTAQQAAHAQDAQSQAADQQAQQQAQQGAEQQE
jgi:hypothetical protein